MSHLVLDDLTKEYNEGGGNSVVAVDDLDISLDAGEFLVLVGPSGCGKSTTLRCIAGLEDITSGTISIDGVVVNDMTPEERDIAMVFQSYALYPHMTARENMSFGLRMTTDLSDEEIAERVDDAARMMGIEELLDDKPRELSGGQQQRVALGRAIVREPEVFLLDEPLSNLDAKLRTRMRTEIQQLQRELDVTTVYVTHDQTEAMTMGDRIAILDGGELQQLGTPMECYHEPTNIFVAGFIGEPSMNFFKVVREGDRLVGDSLSYPLDDRFDDIEGDQFTLGIRPEDVHLADRDGPHTFRATVRVVEPMGDNNLLIVDVDEAEATVEVEGDVLVDEGDVVRLEFSPDRIHLFDATTGEALVNREISQTDVTAAVVE
jgi:multiple sugar transport system ATP-binding protein